MKPLHYNHYELAFASFPTPAGAVSLARLAALQHVLAALAESIVWLLLRGHSQRQQKTPSWLLQALDLQLTSKAADASRLRLDAPHLRDLLAGQQLDMFGAGVPNEASAYGLVIAALREATHQGPSRPDAGTLLDRGVLRRMETLEKLFPTNEAQIIFHNQQPENTVLLNRQTLGALKATEENIPEPQLVSFLGKLDALTDSSKLVRVKTDNGTVRVSVKKRTFDPAELGKLYAQAVTVQGMGNFNALGKLVGVEATYIGLADEKMPALLRQVPQPTTGRIDVRALHERQDFRGTSLGEMLRLARQMEVPQSFEELRDQLSNPPAA